MSQPNNNEVKQVSQSDNEQSEHSTYNLRQSTVSQRQSSRRLIPAPDDLLYDLEHSNTSESDNSSEVISAESDSDISSSDSEEFSMASYKTAITPEPFTGSEDGQSWLDKFTFFSKFQKLNDEQTLAAFPMLLKDGVFDWFMALPDEKKYTMEHITAQKFTMESYSNYFSNESGTDTCLGLYYTGDEKGKNCQIAG